MWHIYHYIPIHTAQELYWYQDLLRLLEEVKFVPVLDFCPGTFVYSSFFWKIEFLYRLLFSISWVAPMVGTKGKIFETLKFIYEQKFFNFSNIKLEPWIQSLRNSIFIHQAIWNATLLFVQLSKTKAFY